MSAEIPRLGASAPPWKRRLTVGTAILAWGLLLCSIFLSSPASVVTALVAFTLLILVSRESRSPPPDRNPIVIDEFGIRRELATGQVETVAWADLVEIGIVTTDEGPFADDVFFLLIASDGSGCAVPSTAAEDGGLLARIQQLPRFDNLAVIAAMGNTGNSSHTCWKGLRGEGLGAAAAPARSETPSPGKPPTGPDRI